MNFDFWPLSFFSLLLGVMLGLLLARRLHRWARTTQVTEGVDPHLLPDPALRWLLRAHDALGAWISEPAQSDQAAPRWQRVVAEGRLTNPQIELIEQRLQRARHETGSGAERLDCGILLYGMTSGIGAGLVLAEGVPKGQLEEAGTDLIHLLEGLSRRPLMQTMAEEQGQPIESVGSVGLRLAYQLERILNAEVIVAVTDKGNVRVVGISGRADRRLLDTYAVPASPVFQVARGELASHTSIADPLGGNVPDRRSRFTPAIVLPIKSAEEPVGAVAFWSADEAPPIAPVIAEVNEVMRNAGPRFVRALEMEVRGEAATLDPLTGLKNRRGLEETVGLVGARNGALLYADLDKFKLLNDTLGHPAGDAALVHFTRIVQEQIRGGDSAARIGGEEFAVWLPGATLGYGMGIADRIRIKLGTTPWDWQGHSWPLSASFGVAACPETTRSPHNLAGQADAALMAAKRAGRNRVESARLVGVAVGAG
ncbi:MAG: GGDEF domain-containing protein [Gemmatimonadales bacterium]